MKRSLVKIIGFILICTVSGCSLLESENETEAPVVDVEKIKETKHAVAGNTKEEGKTETPKAERDPEYSTILTKQGLRFLKDKQYSDAQKLFTKAILLDPKNSEAAESLKAVEAFLKKKEKTKDTQYSDVLTNRGVNLMEEEKYEEAIGIFERAIQSDSENTIATRKRKEAIKLLEKQKIGDGQESSAWSFVSDEKAPAAPIIEEADSTQQAIKQTEELLEEIEKNEEEIQKQQDREISQIVTEEETQDCNGLIENGKIAADFYDGITLEKELPIQFRKGEYIRLMGTIEDGAENVTAFMSRNGEDSTEKQYAFDGAVTENKFTVDIFFPEEGEFLFSLMPKIEGNAKAREISVASLSCASEQDRASVAPTGLKTSIKKGSPVFQWSDDENDLFHVRFNQGEKSVDFYVRDITEFSPPLYAFHGFSEGSVIVNIRGAKTGTNSFEKQTQWSDPISITITAVRHTSRTGNNITDVELGESYTLGETLEISGTTDLSLDETLLIIDPKMDVQESELEISGGKFSGSFTPEIAGNHIFEVNQDDMLSLFVGATVHSGTTPLIPDYFDLEDREKETLPLDKMDEAILALVNAERQKMGAEAVKKNESLQSLAQFRAQDMCNRNYMAHVDPDGKNAGDYTSDFGINRNIGENIGSGESVRSIHEGLMQSASHMRLILNPKNTEVGFGFCWNDQEQLMGVEIFGQ